jgi:hypothetical protein
MRWPTMSALILGVGAILAATTCPAADAFYGLAVFGGTQYDSDEIWHTSENLDWREIGVRPFLGTHKTDRWDLWVEANLEYIEWEDEPGYAAAGEEIPFSIEAGLIGMTSYDVLKQGPWSLYGELGVGVGWLSETPDKNLVDTGILGFLDYGLGVKARTESGYIFKLGAKFHHRSCLTSVDAGVNSYGVTLSLAKER